MLKQDSSENPGTELQLLSHSGQVLFFLAHNPGARMRDISEQLGLTERAVLKIVADLENAGLLTRSRHHADARRYQYQVHIDQALRHPAEAQLRLASLLPIDQR